jgi:hypothetical protein
MTMKNDPIIDEIHQVRERMWEESGCTLEKYMEYVQSDRSLYKDRLVSLEEFRAQRAAQSAAERARA